MNYAFGPTASVARSHNTFEQPGGVGRSLKRWGTSSVKEQLIEPC